MTFVASETQRGFHKNIRNRDLVFGLFVVYSSRVSSRAVYTVAVQFPVVARLSQLLKDFSCPTIGMRVLMVTARHGIAVGLGPMAVEAVGCICS